MKYSWILFDADETLFRFDAYQGLRLMFSRFNIDFSVEDYQIYEAVNQPLWVDYQEGRITSRQLQEVRFESWARRLNMTACAINDAFVQAMTEICEPLPGARELVLSLRGRVRMGIITNGFTAMQNERLQRTGLSDAFAALVVSEEVGVAKPDVAIFEHAFTLMDNPPREQILMVGDNPHSDILGGINAGIDTCWLNTRDVPAPQGITPSYQVGSLRELQQILLA
ncbi:dUMP phosphatase [Edwardsiella ictaluri]|nr:pyrimidine 5'-nucleotidase [Edwardsiella ictaluri]ARD40602.1 noncanonical pyrimidine nucleotidase, YjjG family [Edwardsiella ictaluri]AVZ81395.1 dUMP phosphatase [Edwardsiella ictaluri]EKS7762629.1 pyrimidine 5'-nucleotidase [Edwardsiella ictaluri]EKS7769331.1 pyrimidine 5'-nucleotidase [Edwardsiella ictaluri]EKS7772480.1 pyrimidine 5'-nucleotidase [Edwardsiella ictaluri]